MVNYDQGKIYKIVCNISGLQYIRNTCEPTLARGLAKHIDNYKSFLKEKRRYIYHGLRF